jgi:hypothetical protein
MLSIAHLWEQAKPCAFLGSRHMVFQEFLSTRVKVHVAWFHWGTTHILNVSRGLASCRESARLAGATGEPVQDFLACARKSR